MRLFIVSIVSSFLSLSASTAWSATTLNISSEVLDNRDLPFLEHNGPVDVPFVNAVAMNVRYEPVKELKSQIEQALGLTEPLKIFTGWNANGEAHVTTITPVEFDKEIMRDSKPLVTPERMNEIAREFKIQESDLHVLGLGRGQALIGGKLEDTYFVIVHSENLLRIRGAIHAEFVRNGGNASDWDPNHFFPHITIGYTSRDLHENDGVIKDVEHSLDRRFQLLVELD